MNNKKYSIEEIRIFASELEKRTKDFAIQVIRFSSQLPHNEEWKVIRNQLTKSGTSIGANYREANRSRSKADFRNKIKICQSEAAETVYWLEIIDELGHVKNEQDKKLLSECSELLAIFTKIGAG